MLLNANRWGNPPPPKNQVRENERGIANLRVNVRCVATAIEHQVWWRYGTFKSLWKWWRYNNLRLPRRRKHGDGQNVSGRRAPALDTPPCVWKLRPVFGVETWAEDPRRPWSAVLVFVVRKQRESDSCQPPPPRGCRLSGQRTPSS